MTSHQLPLLIFAQSARLLAQSAIQARYIVWVADCFLDTDTPAHRKSRLPNLKSANQDQLRQQLVDLSKGEPCYLVYGSGIEYCSALLANLPNNMILLGNSAESVDKCNKPSYFFELLKKLQLHYPETSFQPPTNENIKWLIKPETSLGGQLIEQYQQGNGNNSGYFQQYINGVSGSALFLAAGSGSQIISINKQLNAEQRFLLTGIETPFKLSLKNKKILNTAIHKISEELRLIGLNSIDFIIDEFDELLILEVNPRASASMALTGPKQLNLIKAHIDTCLGYPLPNKPIENKTYKGFYYLFSSKKLTITSDINWPDYCSDIPSLGTVIEKNQPICSFNIETNTAENCQKLRATYEAQIKTLFD